MNATQVAILLATKDDGASGEHASRHTDRGQLRTCHVRLQTALGEHTFPRRDIQFAHLGMGYSSLHDTARKPGIPPTTRATRGSKRHERHGGSPSCWTAA